MTASTAPIHRCKVVMRFPPSAPPRGRCCGMHAVLSDSSNDMHVLALHLGTGVRRRVGSVFDHDGIEALDCLSDSSRDRSRQSSPTGSYVRDVADRSMCRIHPRDG